MAKTIGVLTLLALVIGVFVYNWRRNEPAPAVEQERKLPGAKGELPGLERVAKARQLRGDQIRARFREAGLDYPPGEIFLRAFKREAELELWARAGGEPFRRVATFAIVTPSGKPGPKRKEGDRQVPEGVYRIDRFNPESSFHLSLGLDYPNASDRVRSDQERPGFDIFIHGRDKTVGCLPLGDEAIEELYLAAADAKQAGQKQIVVHIFPARMQGQSWRNFCAREIARDPSLGAFWDELQPIHDAFEKQRLIPEVAIAADGAYKLTTKVR